MAELIDDDELRNLKILREELEALLGPLNDIIKTGKKLNESIDSAKSTNDLKKANKELSQSQKELMSIEQQMIKLNAQNTNEYRFQQKQLQALKKELKDKSVLGRKDAQEVTAQNSSYTQLSAALRKNQAEWASLKNEKVRASKAGQDLLKVIQDQAKQLTELDKQAKKNTFGEFTDTMKDLKAELKAAKDEMAHLADTVGVESEEFKNASIKAGELADKIGDIQEATKSVSGEPLERMGGSFDLITGKLKALDFKGASAGVKQFSAASKEVTFKQATQGLGTFVKSLGQMGKAILTNPLFLLIALTIAIGVAVVALKDKIKFLSVAFDFVGDSIEKVVQLGKDFLDWLGLATFAADEKAQKIVDAAEKEIEAIQKRYDMEIRIAEAAGKDTTELEKKKWQDVIHEAAMGMQALFENQALHDGKLTEEQQKSWDKFVEIIANANTEIQVIENKAAKEAENKRKEKMLKEQNDLFKLKQFRLQVQIESQKELADNQKKSVDERFAAVQKEMELRRQLAFLEAAEALKAEKLTANGRQLISEQLQKKLQDIEKEGADERTKINVEEAERLKQIHLKYIEDAKKEAQQRVQFKSNEVQQVLNIIKQEAIDGRLTKEEADKEYAKVQKELVVKVTQENIDALFKILNTQKLTDEERAAISQELFDLQTKLTDQLYDQLGEKGKSQLDIDRENLQKTLDLYTMFAGSLTDLSSSLTASKLQDIQTEQNALEERYNREIELAGKNEEAKSKIKNKYERDNAVLEAKKIQAQRRAAIFDKSVSAIQAAIATALAVAKALPNIPLSIAVGIAGAIQVAAILARPIPQYADGTEDHIGGKAVLGDGGGPELYKEPYKPWKLSAATPKIYDLAPHTKVVPYEESMQMIAAEGLLYSMVTDRTSDGVQTEELRQISKNIKSLERTIKQKPHAEFNITRKGVERAMRNEESRTKLLNELFK